MKVLGRKNQDAVQNRAQDILDTLKNYRDKLELDDYGFIQAQVASIVKLTHSSNEYLEWLRIQVDKAMEK